MGNFGDFLEDFGWQVGRKVKNFFSKIWTWLSVRWLLNGILGSIALLPFILVECDVLTVNETIRISFLVLFIFGVIFVQLSSVGFFVRIIRWILKRFRYR